MAAAVEARTCGSCCLKLKELVNSYEEELGLKGKEFDGTKIHAFGSLNFYLEHSKFTDLLNSIRSKCESCATWPDPAKAIKASLERQQQVENLAPVKNYISECLDKLQSAMREKSTKVVAQRLEAITRKVGLKFIESGRDCFINSDMFYVEVRMDTDGTVSEVKVAHTGDPESCPELTRVLREGDYDEFLCHLQGLCDLYQLSRDTFQKPKILAALKAVETDINTMATFYGTDISSTEAITQCPVGFVTPRQGGRRMRLAYFASPYELLDVNRPGQDRHFTREEPPPRNFGYQVSVSLEQSQKSSLPISPLIVEPVNYGMLGLSSSIKYQSLNDNNSEEFHASFVLELCKPLPAAVEVVHKIYEVLNKGGTFTHSSRVPIDSLIIREWLKEKGVSSGEHGHGNKYYASLPQHYHVYHVTENQSTAEELVQPSGMGLLLFRISFTHASQIPDIIPLLRRQAMFNTLLTSALRSHKPLKKKPNSEEFLFELRASEPFTLTVTFEHPCTSSMASIDFFVSEDLTVKATLTTVPGKPLFCSNDYISRVTQRCLSIPAAMRCIIRKAQSVKLEELPVKASEELPLPLGTGQPATKLASLSLPSSAALFGAAVRTPSNPNTPVFLGTSPSFTAFTLETPSPTFSAFPFSSISPTFSFSTGEVAAAATAAADSPSTVTKQPEKKPDSTKTPNLKITLKRKRDDEYVIQNFQLPEEVPKSGGSLAGSQTTSKNKDTVMPDSIEGDNFSFDLATVSGGNFVMGTTFPDVTAGLDGSAVVSSGSASAGQHVAMTSSDSIAAASGLGIVPAGIEGLPTTADLFDADGTDLEGILQNLSGASHLPPGIVSGSSALDFDTGLGAGVPGLDVTDPNFDIDAAIDASAAADPSIAGTAGAFDVDSTLDFDLDHIAGVRGLPPDVTGTADLLVVSGLGDGTVDIDMPGTSQSKI